MIYLLVIVLLFVAELI